jgi:ornithine cyclodeaminase
VTIPVLAWRRSRRPRSRRSVLDTVRAALVAHAEGRTTVPPPLHLDFPEAGGDCHVKAGLITGADDFTVKIASGFYRNPEQAFRPTTAWCACSARVPARCAPSSTTGDG